MTKKVIIAMSGGMDSSVAAAQLIRAGFDVVGIFMKFWSPNYSEVEPGAGRTERNASAGRWNRCCSPEAEKRARLVADKLGIPFYVFNFEREFKEKIVDYFLAGYKAGITPNPCVVCNKEIKFGLLLEKALGLKADYVATGHYARLQEEKGRVRLLRGKDREKDQSYFLWQLSQRQLKHILFPVGGYTKNQVRLFLKKLKLPLFNVPESQEICFVRTSVNDFLRRHLKSRPGRIINAKEKTLGEHRGLPFYTIGQRKGIELSGGPYYVLEKDLEKNLLIVTKNEKDLYKKELIVKDVNWISGEAPKLPLKIKAKIRYGHRPALATVYPEAQKRKYKILFSRAQRAITPGQSAVFYSAKGSISGKVHYAGEELLGGGIIC